MPRGRRPDSDPRAPAELRLRAARFGTRVRTAPGTVFAVFSQFARSCYAASAQEDIVCLGDASIGCGPLNVIVPGFAPPAPGSVVRLSFEGASLWRAPPHAAPSPAALRALEAAARGRTPHEGLGACLVGASNPLVARARPALEALARWVEGAELDSCAAQLLGMGPGLTPSGDDYLGGMLIALRADPARTGRLWRLIEPQLATQTSRISAAHLRAAAAGEGHEALHACLAACGRRDRRVEREWPRLLDRLDRLGHCSGWDALAGALAVLRATPQAAARSASSAASVAASALEPATRAPASRKRATCRE